MNKLNEKEVRVVYIPSATIARAFDPNDSQSFKDEKRPESSISMLQRFIDEVDLFKIKPDTRIFGYGHGGGGYEIWATIPDDLDVPAPLTKETRGGGLYARHPNDPLVLGEWIEDSDKYQWVPPAMEEYINPIDRSKKSRLHIT